MYSSPEKPLGREFMAYTRPSTTSSAVKMAPTGGRAWDDVRKEARKLEGELDVKLAAYAKLCSGFESSYRSKVESSSLGADQLAQSKAAELEDLLQRLSDLNDEMGGLTGGAHDARSHTLARHRDILQEYTQEFRRLNTTLGATRDRVQLLGASSDSPHIGLTMTSSGTSALLRERGAIQNSTTMIDDILRHADATHSNLKDQGKVFDNIMSKLDQVGARFPVVNSLLKAISRKKSKDTLVLSAVIASCILFTIIYVWMR